MIDPHKLPTHLANVVRRSNAIGDSASADTFLLTSYVVEAFIKTIAIALTAGVRKSSPNISRKLDYDLIQGDGLGTWEKVIGDLTAHSIGSYLDSDLQTLVSWLIKKRTQQEDSWARDAIQDCCFVLERLGMIDVESPSRPNVRFLLSQLVRIRNKTKAHGAVGPDFFHEANPRFANATTALVENSPLTSWEWFHLSVRPEKKNVRAIRLHGLSPQNVRAAQAELLHPNDAGIHFRTHDKGHLFHCGELLRCNKECSTFLVPNGGYTATGIAEFIDYGGSGAVEHVSLPQFLTPPATLPPSATEGGTELDIFSNALGNLPARPDRYVERPKLEFELLARLRDRNHTIITLHGRGGIGKTSLAIHVVHLIADETDPAFDYVLWLSARDLELKPSGASEVRRGVSNLESVCKTIGGLLGTGKTVEDFARVLQDPTVAGSKGILFVFDNFETLDNPRALHEFLDTHTHIPNKILITSRERAFKGDYPIEVGGMELDEATRLLRQEANVWCIGSLMTDEAIQNIFEYTDGHAYVMRVLLGEIAKEGRWVPLKSLVPKRTDLLNVVFERSFNRLSSDGKWVFLCVANWRSAVPELLLLVVLGRRDLDAEKGLEECVRLALLTRHEMADESYCYSAPELARLFARKKLEGDPDRLLVQEDVELLREFGALKPSAVARADIGQIVRSFVERCLISARSNDATRRELMDSTLSRIAALWPEAWLGLAKFRQLTNSRTEAVSYALRRAVEEQPFNKEAWQRRAEFALHTEDVNLHIACLVSAVETDPSDVELVRETAYALCKFVDAHKIDIPRARRGVYLASVRSHMERLAEKLDATGLSRLAWLFLLEDGGEDSAWKYANLGLSRDSTSSHCLKIVQRLDGEGYRPKA